MFLFPLGDNHPRPAAVAVGVELKWGTGVRVTRRVFSHVHVFSPS